MKRSKSDRAPGVGERSGGPGVPTALTGTRGQKESREATCEKILSWHSASADDEINSMRGCGSTMSTGHTPRFERIRRASEPRIRRKRDGTRERERKRNEGERKGRERYAGVTETRRVLTHVLSAPTTF